MLAHGPQILLDARPLGERCGHASSFVERPASAISG